MKVKKRVVLYVCFLLIYLPTQAFAAAKVKIGTGVKANPPFFLPVMAAQEQRLWAQQGIEGEWIPFDSSVAMASAAVIGAIDMGIHTVTGLILVVSRKVPVIGVGKLAEAQPWYIYVRPDSPIKGVNDLKDIKLGVARMGDQPTAYARALAKQLGFTKEIKIVALGGVPQMVAGLRSGIVDAVGLTPLNMAKMMYEGMARVVADVGKYAPRGYDTTAVYAGKALLRDNPEVVKRALTALVHGARYASDNPAWTVNRLMGEMGWPEGLAKKFSTILGFSRDGVEELKGIEALRDFMVEYDLLARGAAPSLEDIYTTALIPIP